MSTNWRGCIFTGTRDNKPFQLELHLGECGIQFKIQWTHKNLRCGWCIGAKITVQNISDISITKLHISQLCHTVEEEKTNTWNM